MATSPKALRIGTRQSGESRQSSENESTLAGSSESEYFQKQNNADFDIAIQKTEQIPQEFEEGGLRGWMTALGGCVLL
jgi:hypothetical protein